VRAARINTRRRFSTTAPQAFSLLEVILAIAILTTAVAMLGECLRTAMRSAQSARNTTKAELFCESKLAELVAGILPAESVADAQIEEVFDDSDVGWLYSIDVLPLDELGLLEATVTVRQDLPDNLHPARVSLTRWIVDPSVAQQQSSATE
jgi:type II secretion system protein I